MTTTPTPLEQRAAEAMVREVEKMAEDGRLDGRWRFSGRAWSGRDWDKVDRPVVTIDATLDLLPLARAALAAAGVDPREIELLRELKEIEARPNPGKEPYARSEYEIDRVRDRRRVFTALAALAAGQEEKPHE